MASFDYAGAQDDADELLAEFGASATLNRITDTFDENTGLSTEEVTPHTTTAVLFSMADAGRMFGAGDRTFSDLFDGATKRERRLGLISPKDLAVTPATGDRLVFASASWEVLGVDTLKPDGATAVLHTVGLQA
jgi:hypothetical protein